MATDQNYLSICNQIARRLNVELVDAGFSAVTHTFDIWHMIKVNKLTLVFIFMKSHE
jgi:hypothetical protein